MTLGTVTLLVSVIETKDLLNPVVIAILISLVSLVVALTSVYYARKCFEEGRNSTYILLFDIIKRHHSPEITELRKVVLTSLKSKCEEARSVNQKLVDYAPKVHANASELANYYEALGMFLQGGWNYLPPQAKEMFLEMLHNSVTNTWGIYATYRETIYAGNSPDWIASYQWLYKECVLFRRRKGLTSAPDPS